MAFEMAKGGWTLELPKNEKSLEKKTFSSDPGAIYTSIIYLQSYRRMALNYELKWNPDPDLIYACPYRDPSFSDWWFWNLLDVTWFAKVMKEKDNPKKEHWTF